MDVFLELAPLAGVLIVTGCIAGVLAGLLGVGGGIIVVPVLFTMLGLIDINKSVRMHVAVGTSLASIVITSLISARSRHRRGAVDTDLLKKWGIWILIGSVAATGGFSAWCSPLSRSPLRFIWRRRQPISGSGHLTGGDRG
jgi:uncharacterized membrane protein YfcA